MLEAIAVFKAVVVIVGVLEPETNVQVPALPVLPVNCTMVALHNPDEVTLAVAFWVTFITRSGELSVAQLGPLLDVHLRVYVPIINPDSVAVGLVKLENVGVLGPLSTAHVPVPVVMVLPVSTVEVSAQRFCVAPTVGVVGVADILYCTSA